MTPIKSSDQIHSFASEFILQFFGYSLNKVIFIGYKYSDYLMLKLVCKKLLSNTIEPQDQDNKDYSILVKLYLLEIYANHCHLVSLFANLFKAVKEIERNTSEDKFRESHPARTRKESIELFDCFFNSHFTQIKQNYLEKLENWLKAELVEPRQVHQTMSDQGLVIVKTPLTIPSFMPVRLLSLEQRNLAKDMLKRASKYFYQNKYFITNLRVSKLVHYEETLQKAFESFQNIIKNKKTGLTANTEAADSIGEPYYGDLQTFIHEEKTKRKSMNLREMANQVAAQPASSTMNKPTSSAHRARFISISHNSTSNPSSNHLTRSHGSDRSAKLEQLLSTSAAKKPSCAICNRKVIGLLWLCPKCMHGGHINHMKQWFAQNSTCPTCFNCNCQQYINN